MNGLEILIIPLIALAVWVLQYLFRGPDENKPANRARPGQARPGNRPPQRRPVTDLDRYLEETRRRRQQEENRPVIIAEVVPEPPPRIEPERRRPPAPRPAPRVERRPARVPSPAPEPVRRPSVQPETVRPVLLESAPVAVPVPEALPARAPTSVPQGPEQNLRKVALPDVLDTRSRAQRQADASLLLGELTRLFRTPQGMAAALVLQEVLGRPLSQRRR
ncbi:MAG: hypothetical protein HYS12_00790 [Planctomycetes bacterium]|nr:hypothetical protein [Planctomycetota bacterium]